MSQTIKRNTIFIIILLCIICDSIAEVQEDMLEHLETQVYKKNGFILKKHSIKFYGYCKNALRIKLTNNSEIVLSWIPGHS